MKTLRLGQEVLLGCNNSYKGRVVQIGDSLDPKENFIHVAVKGSAGSGGYYKGVKTWLLGRDNEGHWSWHPESNDPETRVVLAK